ncbi:hypothetical protein B0H65DRAFT_434532 [Neurospora tetraspora]|uniref:Poly A polymerase C-terminal region-like protein n=1 Tax=Neurospora tetraspora TaxID=94610 RepID=A0AAE0MNI8_9PEZI|nr:hypothetical protein B0H65DRAFT_434532 [Neurospora tetraspora]
MKRKFGDFSSPPPPSDNKPEQQAPAHLEAQASDSAKRQAIRATTPPVIAAARTRRQAVMADSAVFTDQSIPLNAVEAQLKGLLVDVAEYINKSQEAAEAEKEGKNVNEPVILRWAGGWVRDKLLGTESHDIDVAINNMTGEAFALRLRDYCDADPAHRERHSIGPADVGNLHKIARNPDKSKHLETTTIKLFGLDVDFVNLRKETYTEDSRNPQVEFGTAEEDALRRDATVNALFYNLHTGKVEDFTGGMKDMDRNLIRTPLEPLQTFMDDPLRVLRLIRFASRLGFTIDEEAKAVMGDERVLEALKLKISRERIGVELEKMLKGPDPLSSLTYINDLSLYHTLFTDSSRPDFPRPPLTSWPIAYQTLHSLSTTLATPGSIYSLLVTSPESAYFAWNLAALVPFAPLPDDPPLKGGKPAPPLATQAAREGYRAPNKLTDVITASHRHRQAILAMRDLVVRPAAGDEGKKMERDRLGMAIRGWDSRPGVGANWRLQVLYAVLVDVAERTTGEEGKETVEDVLKEWQAFLDHLVEMDLMDAPSVKRIIDGKQLAAALGVKPGKWMGQALEVVMAWQLRNPTVGDPEGAVEEVRKRKEELGIK